MMMYDIEDLPNSDLKQRMIEDSANVTSGIERISNIIESMRELSQKSKEIKIDTNIYETIITSLTLVSNKSNQISKIKLNNEDFHTNSDKNKEIIIANIQKQRVEQVWIIIINNALDELVKIEDYENRLLDISIKLSSDKKNIIIKFKDNAHGIPEEIIENIFEPFMSTKDSGGMGVGLNIAKTIIHEQNGEIVAYNENKQAVFEVILPC